MSMKSFIAGGIDWIESSASKVCKEKSDALSGAPARYRAWVSSESSWEEACIDGGDAE